MRSKNGIILAKIAVTLSILAVVAWMFDWRAVVDQILGYHPAFFALAVAIFLLQIACQVLRLRLIAAGDGDAVAWGTLTRLTFASHAVNQVVPSVAGGDALRIVLLHRGGVPAMHAVRQVTFDRMMGLVGLVAVVLAAWPFVPASLHRTLSPERVGGLVALVVAGIGLALLLSRLIARRRHHPGPLANLARLGGQLWQGVESQSRRPVLLAAVFGVSIVNQLLWVLGFWVIAWGMPLAVTFPVAAFLLPVTTLVMMLPFSIAGWGVREAVLAVGLGMVGIPGDAAVASSVVFGLSTTLVGVLSLPLLVHVWGRPDMAEKRSSR
ncbi:lysylphosphatidylglycerol synthase transmembrane domain-containing protein [Geminicoccus roseus]|uniref:lysylphosphatidylglycerol synthase transmembrane domain-containing protein n=1 Tax=Geminicoccus roseus TaxID=404900 RepID=UPI00040E9F36|nr:lysylphosphatidylglycerol synthase transmembrane domain-containing protein [Geminicoccus roseus]